MSRYTAPIREVVSVEADGRWGRRVHRHVLACGHVEPRKRVAPGPIRCPQCESTYGVEDEVSMELLRQKLAAGLRVSESAVSFNVDPSMRLRGATVFLSPDEVRGLAR